MRRWLGGPCWVGSMKSNSSKEALLPMTQEKGHKDKRMRGQGVLAALGYMGCAGGTARPFGLLLTIVELCNCNFNQTS